MNDELKPGESANHRCPFRARLLSFIVHRSPFIVLPLTLAPAGCLSLSEFGKKSYATARSLVTSSYQDPHAEEKMAEAERLFADDQYKAARGILGDLAANTQNPVLLAEKARFLEAECLRLEGKLPEAADTYHKLVLDFSNGAYRQRACDKMFEVADYWLDDTRAEIQAEKDGVSFTKEKIFRQFRIDKTKPALDREGRALQALERIQQHDPTGPSADKALFWCGYVNFYRGRFPEADHYFSMIAEFHKDSPYLGTATELAIIAKNNSTGGAVYDGQKAAEALQLVHHTQATMPEYVNDPEKSEWLTRQKLAIRAQQAEKDFRTAEYYDRTKHPGSAYFLYDLVRRRYPGTKFSDLATERMQVIREKAEQDPDFATRDNPVLFVRRQWDRLRGTDSRVDPDAAAHRQTPAGPKDAPGSPPPDFLPPR